MATSLTSGGVWLAGLVLWGLSGIAGATENDRPPFYQFEHGGKKVSLLGSIHLGKADFYPLPAVIETAFASSAALVVEADIGASPAEAQKLLTQYAVKPSKPDAKTAALLGGYCSAQQQVCSAIAAYSPWLQASQITVMRFTALGYSAELGVDMQLLERARGNKTIVELEGMEFQFALMSSLDDTHQWAMVREAIDASDADITELVTHWRSGNVAELDRMVRESMAEEGDNTLLNVMMRDRNKRMADTLLNLLAQKDAPSELMVVVGAGHLVGEESLVSYLSERGIKVTSPLGHCADAVCR
ncbi:TraB/GumN family protein [Shewanella sp. JM162201]|uniref:TraB/GumN family protein n=1 Tax=Shewanella jiangmenensis TaxID=2837387 RepID=A0ABS5V166_9GAMM|nr:TraB/GumN family protein [Shewanella jiangmenensis]MBT1444165.1 TraB/GumN family protein [Shewanella jiangmenensis]